MHTVPCVQNYFIFRKIVTSRAFCVGGNEHAVCVAETCVSEYSGIVRRYAMFTLLDKNISFSFISGSTKGFILAGILNLRNELKCLES